MSVHPYRPSHISIFTNNLSDLDTSVVFDTYIFPLTLWVYHPV
jgi:hypothetical protein